MRFSKMKNEIVDQQEDTEQLGKTIMILQTQLEEAQSQTIEKLARIHCTFTNADQVIKVNEQLQVGPEICFKE